MNLLYLDGVKVPESAYQLIEGGVTFSLAEQDGLFGGEVAQFGTGPAVAFSGGVTFIGEYASIIRDRLTPSGPNDNSYRQTVIKAEIRNSCCPDVVLFEGEILYDGSQWCDGPESDCSFTVQIQDASLEGKALDCFKSKQFRSDRNFWRSVAHPFVRHCTDPRPRGMNQVLIILVLFVVTIYVTLIPIVAILNAIVSVLVLLGTAGQIQIGFQATAAFADFASKMQLEVIGCGRGHMAPFVTSYLNEACRQCGMPPPQSSVLVDPNSRYSRLMYFSSTNFEGTREYLDPNVSPATPLQSVADKNYDENSPTESIYDALNRLVKPWRLRWWIAEGVLNIERQAPNQSIVVDLRTLPLSAWDGNACYAYTSAKDPAAIQIKFSEDNYDTTANEAKSQYDTEYISFTNNVPHPERVGVLEPVIPYGRARFREDGILPDRLRPFEAWYPGPFIGDTEGYMLLSKEVASEPRLLAWDGVDPIETKVQRRATGNGDYDYNWIMKLNPDDPESLWEFWADVDPSKNPRKNITVTVQLTLNCDYVINARQLPGSTLILAGERFYGREATIQSVVISPNNVTITALT